MGEPLFLCPVCRHLVARHDEVGCTMESCECEGKS